MAGRKKKAGNRYPCGKLVPVYDRGTERAQAQRARFGTHYATALGRAYAGGLLGEDHALALDRYQGGNRFAAVYTRICGGDTFRSPLDQSPRGANDHESDSEFDQRDHDWLFAALNTLDVEGVRLWLDQLVSRAHADTGPDWLDRILADQGQPRDLLALKAASHALDIVAPARKPIGILVQTY